MAMELDAVFVIEETYDEALGTAHQKMDHARSSGDERGRALSLIKAGDALVQMGRGDEAMAYVSEAMTVCVDMKFEEGRAAAMNVISKVHVAKGGDEEELEESLDMATDALKLFRKMGYRKGEALANVTLSHAYQASKKATLAIKHAKEALTILAELGEKRIMAEVYTSVKSAYLVKTPAETFLAAKQMEKAAALFEELGDKSKQAGALHTAAIVQKSDVKKASVSLTKAKALYSEAGNVHGEAAVLETTMTMLLDAGMYFEAVKVGKERIKLFSSAGDSASEAKAMLKLCGVFMENGDHEKCTTLAEVAMGMLAGIGDLENIGVARSLLDGAKHAKAVEEIEASVSIASVGMHVPKTLLVDPGLNKRITSAFGTAIMA